MSARPMREAAPLAIVGAGLLAGLLATPAPAAAQRWRDFRAARQAGDTQSLEVELIYGAGRLRVSPSDAPYLYDARVRYDASRFRPLRGWTREGGRGHLRIAITSVEDADGPATVHLDEWDVDVDFDDLRRRGDELGRVDLSLHPAVITDLKLLVGAASADLDLGGLSLHSLEFATGASETDISFDTPNRVRMERLSLRAGAAEFEAHDLGNARFDRLEFDGAIGDVLLDLSGEWEANATAAIKMGIGELTIRVPRGIGVRIERSSVLISLDAPGFERTDRTYVTPNWDTADIRLEIQLEAAFGSVEVERL